MHHHYHDITSRISENPKWWDEHAVPRYSDFAPNECADIYADEVALIEISCQSCGRRFLVAMSENQWMYGYRMLSKISAAHDFASEELREAAGKISETPLADEIREGAIHFGDPPNVGCCLAGATMNCEDLRVVEYWRREATEWVRYPELEIYLPDSEHFH
jgi:hypothetical protein